MLNMKAGFCCCSCLEVFPKLYWDIIDIQQCVSLRCTIWWFDICICCEMLTTIRLINTFITSHNYCVCVWWELLRSTLLSTFKHNTVLTIVTMLYIRSPKLIHLISGTLYPLISFPHFHHPHQHLATTNLLCFILLCFFFRLHI